MPQIISGAIAPICDRSPLSASDRQIIADVLTWDCQRDVAPEEIETIAISHDIVWVKLTMNRAVPLHVETFRAIRHQQLEEQNDIDVEHVMELEAKLETDEKEIEIDSAQPGVYRVWKDMRLIGTVKRCKQTLCWLASSIYGTQQPPVLSDGTSESLRGAKPYLTSKLAISAVIRAWEL